MDLFTQPEHVPPAVTENPKVVEAFELWRLPADLHFVICNSVTADYAQRAYDIQISRHWNAFNLVEIIAECPHQAVVDQAWVALQASFPVAFIKMAQDLVSYSRQPGLCQRAADALHGQGITITDRQLAYMQGNNHVCANTRHWATTMLALRNCTQMDIDLILEGQHNE
jgi:hypothetical protein